MEVANNVRCLLAARKLAKSLMGVRTFSSSCRVAAGYGGHGGEYQPLPIKTEIGKREVVGFGINGEESYVDTIMAPFPAIRFKEDSAEILKLRQKEKGDWKKLTVAEKKDLYRASFCQTFAEVHAPTGTWKYMVGTSFFLMSMGIWLFYFTVTFGENRHNKTT